jgi:2-amino-4-hydroxy-6-hydroxymethyldihydropteridine diphosphokinase
MKRAYLLLGSNEGDREQWLRDAIIQVVTTCGTVIRMSSIYSTAAWGLEDQPDFLNMTLAIDTNLSPTGLLAAIQQIEKNLGRQRDVKWGQRTLDVDILFYGDEVIALPDLKVPHPSLQERRFALEPLCEIAPTLVHPLLKKNISQLLDECRDPLGVHKL